MILVSLTPESWFVTSLAKQLDCPVAELEYRHFPDGEVYFRVLSDVKDKQVYVVNDLHQPNAKTLELLLLAQTLRSLGAAKVGLVAPYLAYMRQDKVFNQGEGVTAQYFAKLLSAHFDSLVTVDPHLHRIHQLSEVYCIDAKALHATDVMADWIATHVEQPLLIGPDEESEQWVAAVADAAKLPHIVLLKERFGDRDVKVSVPNVSEFENHTPVLVDDIISTGRTMIETAKHLQRAGMKPAVCVGVHGVFADNAMRDLAQGHISQVVTCNTIAHESNQIDLASLFANWIKNSN